MSLFDNQSPFDDEIFDMDGILFDKQETENDPFAKSNEEISPFASMQEDTGITHPEFESDILQQPMSQTPIDFDYSMNTDNSVEHDQFKECFIHGYDKKSVDDYVETLKNDMQRVQTQLNQEVKTITLEKTAVVEERNALRAQLLETTKKIDEYKEEVANLKENQIDPNELEGLNQKLKEYEDQIELRNAIIGEFDEKEEGYLAQIESLKQQEVVSEPNEDLLKQIHELMQEKDELVKKLNRGGQFDETLQQLNKANKALQEAYNGSQDEMNSLYKQVKSLQQEKESYAVESTKHEQIIMDLKQQLGTLESENKAQQQEIEVLTEKQSEHNEDDLEMIASLKETVKSLTERFEEEPEDMSVYVLKAMEYHKQLDLALVDIARLQLENLSLTQENKRLKSESN